VFYLPRNFTDSVDYGNFCHLEVILKEIVSYRLLSITPPNYFLFLKTSGFMLGKSEVTISHLCWLLNIRIGNDSKIKSKNACMYVKYGMMEKIVQNFYCISKIKRVH
jgi:hypothetical protein